MKTSGLTGWHLDWAVAAALGIPRQEIYIGMRGTHRSTPCVYVFRRTRSKEGSLDGRCMTGPDLLFSSKWEVGGPILSEARISRTIDHSGLWIAYWTDGYTDGDAGKLCMQCDRSELVAGLRCFVALKLGNDVEVPK